MFQRTTVVDQGGELMVVVKEREKKRARWRVPMGIISSSSVKQIDASSSFGSALLFPTHTDIILIDHLGSKLVEGSECIHLNLC